MLKGALLIVGGDRIAAALVRLAPLSGLLPAVLVERYRLEDLLREVEFLSAEPHLIVPYRPGNFKEALEEIGDKLLKRGMKLNMVAITEQVDMPVRVVSTLESEEELGEGLKWAMEVFRKLRAILARVERGARVLTLISVAADYPMEYKGPLSVASATLKAMIRALRVERQVREREVKLLMAYPGVGDVALTDLEELEERELSRIAGFILEALMHPEESLEEERPIPFGMLKLL